MHPESAPMPDAAPRHPRKKLTTPNRHCGTEVNLHSGPWQATLCTQGGSLVALRCGTDPLVLPWPTDRMRPCFHGATLAPWPNRLRDGRYRFGGRTHQLALSEPELANSLHGLVCWTDWRLDSADAKSAAMSTAILPQPGYPFQVELKASWNLHREGLTWSLAARNTGETTAPVGLGIHPYLTAAGGGVDAWDLTVPAATVLDTGGARKLPEGAGPVSRAAGTDFRRGGSLSGVQLDHCFTDLQTGRVTVTNSEGRGAALEWNPAQLPFVQVFTSDLPGTRWDRSGVAVEACSCAPDAFNTDPASVALAPGSTREAQWKFKVA